jgi:hypothetical protein
MKKYPTEFKLKAGNGQFIGFKMMTSICRQWSARYRHPESFIQKYKALGDLVHIREADRFTAAKQAAEEWFVHPGRVASGPSASLASTPIDRTRLLTCQSTLCKWGGVS